MLSLWFIHRAFHSGCKQGQMVLSSFFRNEHWIYCYPQRANKKSSFIHMTQSESKSIYLRILYPCLWIDISGGLSLRVWAQDRGFFSKLLGRYPRCCPVLPHGSSLFWRLEFSAGLWREVALSHKILWYLSRSFILQYLFHLLWSVQHWFINLFKAFLRNLLKSEEGAHKLYCYCFD